MGNQQGEDNFYQTILSMKLGDGGIVTQSNSETAQSNLTFSSINKDYVDFKTKILTEGGLVVRKTNVYSGYTGKPLEGIRTHVDPRITKVKRMSITEAIRDLDKYGLMQLILDDGSWHKIKHYYNLYINSFTVEEALEMSEKIYEIYGYKRPTISWDKKKDGRKYPYLYINKQISSDLREDLEKWIRENKVDSMLYKVGIPSTTIERE